MLQPDELGGLVLKELRPGLLDNGGTQVLASLPNTGAIITVSVKSQPPLVRGLIYQLPFIYLCIRQFLVIFQ